MMLRFAATATAADRAAAAAALRERGVRFVEHEGSLALAGAPAPEDAVALAALPGVSGIEPSPPGTTTTGEALLAWTGGAAAVLGVLVLLACNAGNALGQRADPLRTPASLRPSWPLLTWYSAVDQTPAWMPVPLLLVLAAAALFAWPTLGRSLAERRPRLHAALGIAVLLLVTALAVGEATR